MNRKIIMAYEAGADVNILFSHLRRVAGDSQPFLVGAFISLAGPVSESSDSRIVSEASDLVYANISDFKRNCDMHGIAYTVRPDFDEYTFADLVEDSRFADMVMCSPGLLSAARSSTVGQPDVERMMRNLECPILEIPNITTWPAEILFAFDASPSAMTAIKIFTYLFPDQRSTNVLVYSAGVDQVRNAEFLDWMQLHYSQFQWIDSMPTLKNHLCVCGSFGRSWISNFFKSSFASPIIEKEEVPVFMCHC